MMRRTAIRDLGLLLTIAACGGATSDATGTPATNVTVWAGNNQVGFDTVAHLNVPFEARVVDSDGRPLSGVRVTWKVTSGAGTLASYPLDVPLTDATTPTGTDGIASVLFRPRVLGLSVVTASAAGTANPPAEFRVLTYPAPDRPDVLIIAGPLFDCTGGVDSTLYWLGSDYRASVLTATVGQRVAIQYADYLAPACTARFKSIAVPPGGTPFDTGIIHAGESSEFTPNVAGLWTFTDAINGGNGKLTVKPSP